jgi:hypothetical protein
MKMHQVKGENLEKIYGTEKEKGGEKTWQKNRVKNVLLEPPIPENHIR